MKHDFRIEPTGPTADRFCEWLLCETANALTRDYGNGEATKASIFLFVNRAFEAHLPESKIAEIFGMSLVRAGYCDQDVEPAFAWLETFADVSRGVHGGTRKPAT